MKKVLSTVIALLVTVSFTVVGYADAKTKKSSKEAKKEVEVAKQESKKSKYEAETAVNKAKKRQADKK